MEQPIGPPSVQSVSAASAVQLAIRLALLAGVIYWSYILIQPFIPILVWSAILAVALYPVFDALARLLGGRPVVSAILITILGLAIIAILEVRKVKGGIFIGIVATAIIGWVLHLATWTPQPYSVAEMTATAFKLDIPAAIGVGGASPPAVPKLTAGRPSPSPGASDAVWPIPIIAASPVASSGPKGEAVAAPASPSRSCARVASAWRRARAWRFASRRLAAAARRASSSSIRAAIAVRCTVSAASR